MNGRFAGDVFIFWASFLKLLQDRIVQPPGAILGPSWGHPGAILGHLGAILDYLGSSWGHHGRINGWKKVSRKKSVQETYETWTTNHELSHELNDSREKNFTQEIGARNLRETWTTNHELSHELDNSREKKLHAD